MNNIEWGYITDSDAEVLTPGMLAGEGRCENGQWGVIVEGAAIYGELDALREWAASLLRRLPGDRNDEPLVHADIEKLTVWLSGKAIDPDWAVDLDHVEDWLNEIAVDLDEAGWTLGHGVAKLRAKFNEDGDLIAGVILDPVGGAQLAVTMEPISGDDIRIPVTSHLNRVEHGVRVLTDIAGRINRAY